MSRLLFAALCYVAASYVQLTTLPRDSPGKCMDGSPGGFYFDPATSQADASKWVLWLEGGGECTSRSQCFMMTMANPQYGSSRRMRRWIAEMPGYASSDPSANPATATWNRVLLKYCSQDLWSGTRMAASRATFGHLFSGHLILQEVVRHLVQNSDLGSATDVVVSGDSAGGIGSWLNVGWIRDTLSGASANPRVVVAPVAGFYGYAHRYTGPGATAGFLADFSEQAWPRTVDLWQAHYDADCAAALPDRPWACMLANNSRPYVRAAAFVAEAQTDAIQLQMHCGVPAPPWSVPETAFVDGWHSDMVSSLRGLPASDGFFSPACYIHTDFTENGPFIGGRNYAQAFAAWLQGEEVRLMDDCGLLCGHCSRPEIVVSFV